MSKVTVGIIGGGAAGMTAAIKAFDSGAKVTILEHMPRMGKKLLMTGSGKCNISNTKMDTSHFYGSGICFIDELFNNCPPSKVVDFIESIGIFLKDKNGYLYPYSESAASALDCFRFAIRDRNIETVTECNILKIDTSNNGNDGFDIITDSKKYHFDKIIIATGSKAYKNTGSDGSGYELVKKLSHKIIKPLPALTYLNCKENFYSSIAGIRTKGNVTLFDSKDNALYSETGEIQLTKNGISGIPVFNLSFLASRGIDKGESFYALLDFIPDVSENDLFNLLQSRIRNTGNRELEELFAGILHKNIGNCIIKRCGLKPSDIFKNINKSDINRIVKMTKSFRTNIESTGGFDNAQVCCGGIDGKQIKSTMESKLVKNLFFAGEVIDINGQCGGYNLHFAFTSAIVAAENACK